MGYVSGSLAAPSFSSPILKTLIFSASVLFRGSDFFSSPHRPRVPFWPPNLRMLALPPGIMGPCLLCPLLLPLARFLRRGLGGHGSHSLWQVVHCSPPPGSPALRGPTHRSRSVPPTANICGGFWLFTSGGARAPRPDGGGHGPPGPSLAGPAAVRVPFLVSDLACLVCTVQIEVVSIYLSERCDKSRKHPAEDMHRLAWHSIAPCRPGRGVKSFYI